jgi:hypothetical protein
MEHEPVAWIADAYADESAGGDNSRLSGDLSSSSVTESGDDMRLAAVKRSKSDSPWDDGLLTELEDARLNLGDVLPAIADDVADAHLGADVRYD